MRALVFETFGGPEVLEIRDVEPPVPGPGEVAVRVTCAGINNFDLQIRRGDAGFPVPLPFIGGMEAVGVVDSVGDGVTAWEPGQRVLRDLKDACGVCRYCRSGREWRCVDGALHDDSISGGFAEVLISKARRLVALPDEISDEAAASVQLSYGTAWQMLIERGHLRAGDTVLVTSVGSGLGAAAVDIAKRAGCFVIGTASTQDKLSRSLERGLDAGIDYTQSDVAEEIMRITGGTGVEVAVDHVGGDTFVAALDSLAIDGRLVTCGWHGGGSASVELLPLVRGRKTIIGTANSSPEDLHRCLDLVARGELNPAIAGVYDLDDAIEAMTLLEDRRSFGKVLLRP